MIIPALFFAAFALGAPQATCTNFSGNYVIAGQDGRVHVSIEQKACSSLKVVWSSSLIPNSARMVHNILLTGTYRPDSGWYGATEAQITSATVRNNTLEIKEKPKGATASDPVAWTLRLDKLPNADLCTRFMQGSINIASLAGKQNTLSKSAEDDAAKRSDKGCPER